jgi:hypothetical protein
MAHLAAHVGGKKGLQYLAQIYCQGAAVDTPRAWDSSTPIRLAEAAGNDEVVEFLLRLAESDAAALIGGGGTP